MNWDGIEGNRHQFKSHVKQQWSMLTDDHLDKIAGRREHLVGKIQENYGVAEHEAECQVMDWENSHQDLFAETAAELRKHNVGLKGQQACKAANVIRTHLKNTTPTSNRR